MLFNSKIPTMFRLLYLSEKIENTKDVRNAITEAVKAKSLWLVPNVLVELVKLAGPQQGSAYAVAEDWGKRKAWLPLLREWIAEKAPVPIQFRVDGDKVIIYPGTGIIDCDHNLWGNDDADIWLVKQLDLMRGSVIRLRERTRGSEMRGATWEPVCTEWPKEVHVDGAWGPSVEQVAGGLAQKEDMVLFGPSGCGKTTTALRAVRRVYGDSSRVLVVTGKFFQERNPADTIAILAKAMGVRCVILDDIQPSSAFDMLDQLDILRQSGISFVVTVMCSKIPKMEGLRPGRVSMFLRFRRPTKQESLQYLKAISSDVDWDSIADTMIGMTPAFLTKLASRVQEGGDMQEAFASVRLQYKIAGGSA